MITWGHSEGTACGPLRSHPRPCSDTLPLHLLTLDGPLSSLMEKPGVL